MADSASESDSGSVDGHYFQPPSPVTREQLQKRIESLQQQNRVLNVELETYKLRVKSLQEENKALRQASVHIQAKAEQEEEFISNTLLKKIQALKKEKENLALNYEQEEECLTNDLSRKLNQLREEKVQLEHTLEQEQECLVNKLMRKIEKLETETSSKQTTLDQLRREKVELENTLEQEQEALVNKLWKRMDKLESDKRSLQIKLDQPVSEPPSPRDLHTISRNGDTAATLANNIHQLRQECARLKQSLTVEEQEHQRKMAEFEKEEKHVRFTGAPYQMDTIIKSESEELNLLLDLKMESKSGGMNIVSYPNIKSESGVLKLFTYPEMKLESALLNPFPLSSCKALSDWAPAYKPANTREEIAKYFQSFMSLLCGDIKDSNMTRKIESTEIDLMMIKWQKSVISLLPFEASNIVKMIESVGFHVNSDVNEAECVLMMLHFFISYAKMKLISIIEVRTAFECIGINIFAEVPFINNTNNEAVLRIHIPDKGFFFKDKASSREFCSKLEHEIVASLKSPDALKWIKKKLNEDEDIITLENQSIFEEFPLDKININVSYAYPGSTICIVNVVFPQSVQNPEERFALIKVITTVLKKIEFLSKVDLCDRRETESNTFQLNVDVDLKKWNWQRKEDLNEFLGGFIDNVRKGLITNKEEMISILNKNNDMTPGASEQLVSKLFEEDEFSIDIKTKRELSVETVQFQNIPVWPLKTRKLSELPVAMRMDIMILFADNFPEKTWLEVAKNLDVFREENNFEQLLQDLQDLKTYISPYHQIVKNYTKNHGTIGGLLSMLQCCFLNKNIRKGIENYGKHPEEVINDMICQVNLQNAKCFTDWWESITDGINHIENTCIANYEEFKKVSTSKNIKTILRDNIRKWDQHMKSIVEEGDQIWMWRNKFKKQLQYAHVGVYIGGDYLIHVSQTGMYGVIRKEKAEDVIKDSKCFIVRPDPARQEAMSGTPKERAKACLGLTFLYSVAEGSCEVFVNCITQGIWTADIATLQGKSHPHVDNVLTIVNAVCKRQSQQAQRKDLLCKLATCLLEKGYNDQNIIQHTRGQPTRTANIHEESSPIANNGNNENDIENDVRSPEAMGQTIDVSSEDDSDANVGYVEEAATTASLPMDIDEDAIDIKRYTPESSSLEQKSKSSNFGEGCSYTSTRQSQSSSSVHNENSANFSEDGERMDLKQFLADSGLVQMEDILVKQEVDLAMLSTLSNDDLKEVGITVFGQRRKLLNAIRKINSQTSSRLNSTSSSPATVPDLMYRGESPLDLH